MAVKKKGTKSAPRGKPARTSAALKQAIRDLTIANRIIAKENVVDAFGHISVRHPKDPTKYLMSRHLPPGIVTSKDIAL